MAASLQIEEESGVFTGRPHPHNGYYAGDFSVVPFEQPDLHQLLNATAYAA